MTNPNYCVVSLTAAVLIAVAPTLARATVFFAYDGICITDPNPLNNINCSAIGLNDNDPVSGTLEFSDNAIVPDGRVTTRNLLAFSLDFGFVQITHTTAADFFFDGILDSGAQSFTTYDLTTSEAVFPDTGKDTVGIFPNSFISSVNGECDLGGCVNSAGWTHPTGEGISIGITRRVPEPPTLTLLALTLLWMGTGWKQLNPIADKRNAVRT